MADKPETNTISGRSAFIELLKAEGVEHLFGNPGTTELPIMHALTDHPDLGYHLGLQESIVIAMADGYARASGKLPACNVHVAPGLGNAMGTLYTAWMSRTPMIVTAGQQEQGHGLTEPLLYAPLVPMATPVVKWATEVTRIEDLPRIVHRAAKVAMTPPTGPVFISLPGDILNDFAAIDIGSGTRIDTAVRPSDATLRRLADAILSADRPMIFAGHELVTSDALDEAAQFAELVGAPVYQQTIAHGAHFYSEHPAYMGWPSRTQPTVRAALAPYDMMISLGADVLRMSVYSEVDPLPPGMRILQIGLNDWELGKNYAAEIAVQADVKETLKALNELLAEMSGPAEREAARARIAALADSNWTAQRAKRAEKAMARAEATPIDPEWLMMRMSDMLPADAIVVDEGITTANSIQAFFPYRDRNCFFGNVSGGIGWGIAAAVGVQVAHPDRRVVAVIGDGSAQYSIQALWTAANNKLPVIFMICNNGGYRIIKQRLKLFHGNETYIGMDFQDPAIDISGLARAYGLKAFRVETGAEFEARLQEALAVNEPVVLEVVVEGTV